MKTLLSLFTFVTMCLSINRIAAQNVLILYDDSPTNANTLALKNSLTNSGYIVTISSVSESSWNNTNPSLNGFDAVIHLNGTSYGSEMPAAGQNALVDFVENNSGAYVQFEWNAYQFQAGQMQAMVDLILFDRISGTDGTLTLNEVSAQSNHPILANVPTSFSIVGSSNVGTAHSFSTNPSVVLMTEGSNDAVAFREFGSGCILGMHNAGNYQSSSLLSNNNVQQLIINFLGHCNACMTVQSDIIPTSCYGTADGSITLTATNGTAPYSYVWSTSDTTSSLSGLSAGSYGVTITDSTGCEKIRTFYVADAVPVTTTFTVMDSVLCFNDHNGRATINISGGRPPFTYLWDSGETLDSAMSLGAGNVVITITDSTACSFTDTVFMGGSNSITVMYNFNPVKCEGDTNGSITANATGGESFLSYLWESGDTITSQTDLTNGIYLLTVTDSLGCSLVDTILFDPLFFNPWVNLGEDSSFCIDWPVALVSNTSGASYLWSNGVTTDSNTISGGGTFWLQVTSIDGCVGSDTIIMTTFECLGVSEINEESDIQLYPNPTNGILNISSTASVFENINVTIFDISGKQVLVSSAEVISPKAGLTLDVSSLTTGTYILKLWNNNHVSVHSVIVK